MSIRMDDRTEGRQGRMTGRTDSREASFLISTSFTICNNFYVFSVIIIFYNKNKVFLFHFCIFVYLDASLKFHIKIDLLPRRPKSLKRLYSLMNLNTISLPW